MSTIESTECGCFLCKILLKAEGVGILSSTPVLGRVAEKPGCNVSRQDSLSRQPATQGHILLVDDDPATLLALTGVLQTRFDNLAVDTCESGVVALDKVATCDYDAIVSDIKMPGMDGLELMHQVLKIRPTTPTLLVTGHGDDALGPTALNAGAYTFIQKPIDRDYFIAWLKRAIHLRQVIRQVEEQDHLSKPTVRAYTANSS